MEEVNRKEVKGLRDKGGLRGKELKALQELHYMGLLSTSEYVKYFQIYFHTVSVDYITCCRKNGLPLSSPFHHSTNTNCNGSIGSVL